MYTVDMIQPHPTRFVRRVNADVDLEVVSLVKTITDFGFTTISSCQGNPGQIEVEGGIYGHVAFIGSQPFNYEHISKFLFVFLRPFVAHMYDDVRLEVSLSEQTGFIGWIHFRNEVLEDISRRLNVYREMLYAK